MLIEIQCTSLSEFDPATGRSGVCGHRLMVDSNQIGQMVQCPKCEQAFEVVASKYDAKTQPATTGNRKKSATRKSAEAGGTPAGQPAKKPRASSVEAPIKTDVMQVSFDDNQLESSFTGDRGPKCKKCGHPAPYGRCASCKHVEPRFAKMHQPLSQIKMQMAGMQLWFCKTLSDGISVTTLTNLAHAGAIIVTVFLLLLVVLQAVVGNTSTAIAITVCLFLGVSFYAGLVYKSYQFLSNPYAKIAWFQRPFWNFVLWLARQGGWEKYDQRLKDRRVVKVTDRGFTDRDLATLSGIKTAQVLDLENTQVTDQGMVLLYRLEHLQCLVLRRTKVTHDAVVRLQQTFPKLWIWY